LNKNNKYKLGVLGGTFDPAHIGHIKISKEAKERFNLKEVIWAVTKKNPFKNKSSLSLKDRIRFAKKLSLKNKFIKINFFENKIKSNKTIDLINYLKRNKKYKKIYFIMGADNLINFHKWKRWRQISSKCNIIVFDRNKYKAKSLKSIAYKRYNKKGLEFISFKKVNISSSQLRKI
tara:strand:+ start:1989 stop:2516 length:528 start_codon:yes stop_codon:yes gene_type:complete